MSMTLSELYTILNSITGFSGKVAYRAFPVGEAPELPFICYLCQASRNFSADGVVYSERKSVDIELYSRHKDEANEALIKNALTAAGLYFEFDEDYIEPERVLRVTFTVMI